MSAKGSCGLTLIFLGLGSTFSQQRCQSSADFYIKPVPQSLFHGLDPHCVPYWMKHIVKIKVKR